MTLSVFQHCLKAYLRRQPFRPFIIELMSGDRLLVVHPEFVSIRLEAIHFHSPEFEHRLFDSASACQFLDVPRAKV